MAIQTEPSVPDHPKLNVKKKDSTNEIKSTCAQTSSVWTSVETSQKVIEIVSKTLYNHNIYLSADEQAENEEVQVMS